jgi:hypothetical protein
MPFQSEKQRRYLWANEPEIARDWTDTYGSGIAKALGGRIGYQDGTLTKEQIAMIKDMKSRGMDTSTIETVTGATADQIKNILPDDQSRLSNEDYLNQMDERQMTANLPYMKDFKYDANKFKNPIQDLDFDIASLESMYGDKGITKALPYNEMDDLEAQNVIPTFQDYEQREEFDERVRNMPTIQDEGIPASERWRNFLSKMTRQPYRPSSGFTPAYYGSGAPRLDKQGQQLGYSAARLNQMNALGGWYSDPARDARRIEKRRTNILNRASAGKPVGNVSNLLGQQGYEATPGGGLAFTGTPQGDRSQDVGGYTRDDRAGWSRSPFVRGGLASLWRR